MRLYTGSSITKLVNSLHAADEKRKREQLIAQSSSSVKELPIVYHLSNVSFDAETRLAKIELTSTKQYRTVERYVTQNYTRYPIYSNWKTKTNTIEKRIKLTNRTLENLNAHEDELIRQFSSEIILGLDDESLIPSWLAKEIIYNSYYSELKVFNIKIGELENQFNRLTYDNEKRISAINTEIKNAKPYVNKLSKKIDKLSKKIKYVQEHKPSILLSILSLGIYFAYCSQWRERKLSKKLEIKTNSKNATLNEISDKRAKIESIKQSELNEKNKKNAGISELRRSIRQLEKERDIELRSIQPLDISIQHDDFLPLKSLIGIEYEKIIGCYIIHNKENHKYYVGQSKDVLKRLKQHFHGTVPNNVIFAEDYYCSQSQNKDDLFEVKIIRLTTKDELDETEARLITEYEANTKGYNSTKGNS